jgi:hypothetical protein
MTGVRILRALYDMHVLDARWEDRVFRKHVVCLKQANRDLLKICCCPNSKVSGEFNFGLYHSNISISAITYG